VLFVYIQFTDWADLPEITGPAIPYNHLSSEETEPYMVRGKTPDRKADIRAAKKWPDARSCLIRSELKQKYPDLRKINWRKMRMDTDIEVCMFRIFNSLGTPELNKHWFMKQGLSPDIVNVHNEYVQTWVSVQGTRKSPKLGGSLVPPKGIRSLVLGSISWSESFSASWDKTGKLISVSHSFTYE